MITINKDTKLYGSFSENPGNNGCVFFNSKFEEYNINAIYKSFYSTDIDKTILSVKHLNFSGFALSMPLKEKVYDFLDEFDESVISIRACNTVINVDGTLHGYNTDWVGVYKYFENKGLNHINIIGFGGFGKAVSYAFNKLGISFSIVLRKDIENIDDVSDQYFINATPADIKSNKNIIIDARPFTEEGKIIANLQAKEQFRLYTGINLD